MRFFLHAAPPMHLFMYNPFSSAPWLAARNNCPPSWPGAYIYVQPHKEERGAFLQGVSGKVASPPPPRRKQFQVTACGTVKSLGAGKRQGLRIKPIYSGYFIRCMRPLFSLPSFPSEIESSVEQSSLTCVRTNGMPSTQSSFCPWHRNVIIRAVS